MEKTPRNRSVQPDLTIDSAPPLPNMHGSALQTQGLPRDQAHPPPLSTRAVAVSDRFSVAKLAWPLPVRLNKRPLFDHLLRTVVGRSDEEKWEVSNTVTRILCGIGMRLHSAESIRDLLDDDQRERLCRLFCGEEATVLVTKESRHTGFIVLPHCADIALLQRLVEILASRRNPVPAAGLLCAAMLALRDNPERASDLLKSYCQLILNTEKQLPAPPLSLKGLIDAVQDRAPGCLLASEIYALNQHFEISAKNEKDPVKVKGRIESAHSLVVKAIHTVESGDSGQRRDLQLVMTRGIEAHGVPMVSPDAEGAHQAAAAAYEEIKDFLPHVGMKEGGVHAYKEHEPSAVDQHGTLHPDSLMEYLELAAKAPGFMLAGVFDALIRYGKDDPDTPFTPAAIRSLWIEFQKANPTEIDAVTAYWLATTDVDVGVAEGDVIALIEGLPSWAELQTLFRLNESGDEAGVQRIHRISTQLSETGDKLLKLIQSFVGPYSDTLPEATQHFTGLVAHMAHRASYARTLAGGAPPTFGDIDAMIPQPEEAIFLSAADHRMLLEAALRLPPDQSVALARRLVVSQFDGTQRKDLEVLCQALELDAQNVPPGEILEVLREEPGSSALSSDLAMLLSSALIARLTQRDLSDDECRQLAKIAVTLAVPKPGERLTNCLTHFFKQVGEQLLRTHASTVSLDRLFAPLIKGLMLRLEPEALASMRPAERNEAQIALAACFAGRGLLRRDLGVGTRWDARLGLSRPDFLDDDWQEEVLSTPPLLKGPVLRIARGYFYLCLHYHFAVDVAFGLASGNLAQGYLAKAFQDLHDSWPELDSMFGVTLATLSEPMSSQFLQAVHEASESSVQLFRYLPVVQGRELLEAWVRSTTARRALGF